MALIENKGRQKDKKIQTEAELCKDWWREKKRIRRIQPMKSFVKHLGKQMAD